MNSQTSKINNNEQTKLYEPITDEAKRKFTVLPIQYEDVWWYYKRQVACFWKEEELDFSHDYEDFMSLNKGEQHFVEMILAFFAASDGIVNFNLSERFTREITNTEILMAYQFQMMMENIHSTVYSLMLENIVKDTDKRAKLFNAIETVPSVKKMADWAFEWIDSGESLAHRVVAFAIVEGIFFSGAFAAIFWLKKTKQGKSGKPFMNGFITSNKFISRDEGIHTYFACCVYDKLINKLNQEEILKIMIPAVDIAKSFIVESIPVRLIGMNSNMMCEYIENVADRLLFLLGYKKFYNTANPFKFMATIGLNDKSNFFEVRPHEYQDADTLNKSGDSKNKAIVLDEDF